MCYIMVYYIILDGLPIPTVTMDDLFQACDAPFRKDLSLRVPIYIYIYIYNVYLSLYIYIYICI